MCTESLEHSWPSFKRMSRVLAMPIQWGDWVAHEVKTAHLCSHMLCYVAHTFERELVCVAVHYRLLIITVEKRWYYLLSMTIAHRKVILPAPSLPCLDCSVQLFTTCDLNRIHWKCFTCARLGYTSPCHNHEIILLLLFLCFKFIFVKKKTDFIVLLCRLAVFGSVYPVLLSTSVSCTSRFTLHFASSLSHWCSFFSLFQGRR